MFCTKCGKKMEENEMFCARCGTPVKGSKAVKPVPVVRPQIPKKTGKIVVGIFVVLLLISGVKGLFSGGNSYESVIKNYFSSIEQQSYTLLRKAVQSDIADQIQASALGEYSEVIALVNYDLGNATPMSSSDISTLENYLLEKYGVSVNISEGYNVSAYVETTTIWSDSMSESVVLQVYKTKGKWYIVPTYSRKK